MMYLPDLVIENTMKHMSDDTLKRFCRSRQDFNVCREIDHVFWLDKIREVLNSIDGDSSDITLEDRGNKSYQEWYFSEIVELKNLIKYGQDSHFDVSSVIRNDHSASLKYFDVYINTLDPFDINRIACSGNIRMLEWLSKRSRYPTQNDANDVASHGQLEILKWLDQHGIHPNWCGANDAADHNHFDVIEWLASKRIHPAIYKITYILNTAVFQNDLNVVKFWVQHGYYPNQSVINFAKSKNAKDVINWLADNPLTTQIVVW